MLASRKALIVVTAFVLMALGLPWGGNVPAAFAQIQVLSANPTTGDQGTLGLNVTIGGKGFKKGAKAYFYLKGTTNPAGITVRAAKFVGDTSLIATIDIAAGATPDDFDIVVANADGRTGKGTELFKVTEKINSCTLPPPVPTGGYCFSSIPGFPGCLDTTFGYGTARVVGQRNVTVGAGVSNREIAVDSAGRIVAVGRWDDRCTAQSSMPLVAVRHLPDGSPDLGFGVDGMVTIAFLGGSGSGSSVAVQADNKIVVAGTAVPTKRGIGVPMVVRLNENGSLDATFGSGGIVWVSQFGNGGFHSVTLQSDGKIVVAGSVSSGYVKIVSRLNTNGTPDVTFNGSGNYLWNASGMFRSVTTQRVGLDERIVVVGYTPDSLNHLVGTIWRFTSAGAPDTGFGGTGVVKTPFHVEDGRSYEDVFLDVAVDSSNRIVAAGSAAVGSDANGPYQSQVALARYDVYGNLDASFGAAGRLVAPTLLGDDDTHALAIQADGRLLVAGASRASLDGPVNVAIRRFNANGSVDTTFGNDGSVLDTNASGLWNALALQPDGRIICGAMLTQGSNPIVFYPAFARYWQ
jgi:uncharacterized delta-60 repeat protein